jgi:hypothetical protein
VLEDGADLIRAGAAWVRSASCTSAGSIAVPTMMRRSEKSAGREKNV